MAPVTNAPTAEDLADWYKMAKELSALKVAESLLRKRLFAHYFTDPREGVNNHNLDDGFVLKGGRVVNRKIIPDELLNLRVAIDAEGSNLPKLDFRKLVKYTPELVKAEYNKLSDEDKLVFDRCLEIKDGSPTLDVVKPKR